MRNKRHYVGVIDTRNRQLPVGDRDDLEDRHRPAQPPVTMDEVTLLMSLDDAEQVSVEAHEDICPID